MDLPLFAPRRICPFYRLDILRVWYSEEYALVTGCSGKIAQSTANIPRLHINAKLSTLWERTVTPIGWQFSERPIAAQWWRGRDGIGKILKILWNTLYMHRDGTQLLQSTKCLNTMATISLGTLECIEKGVARLSLNYSTILRNRIISRTKILQQWQKDISILMKWNICV